MASSTYQQQKAWAKARVARRAEEREKLAQAPEIGGNCYGCGVRADVHETMGCAQFTRGPHG